jgi:hypothetical protein
MTLHKFLVNYENTTYESVLTIFNYPTMLVLSIPLIAISRVIAYVGSLGMVDT